MSKYEGNNRYQFQRWYIKAYRQVRYRPGGWLRSLGMLANWAAHGAPIDGQFFKTRRRMVAHIWMIGRSLAAMDMGHYYSYDEVTAELRGRCKPPN